MARQDVAVLYKSKNGKHKKHRGGDGDGVVNQSVRASSIFNK